MVGAGAVLLCCREGLAGGEDGPVFVEEGFFGLADTGEERSAGVALGVRHLDLIDDRAAVEVFGHLVEGRAGGRVLEDAQKMG